jgi:hypothetical protein
MTAVPPGRRGLLMPPAALSAERQGAAVCAHLRHGDRALDRWLPPPRAGGLGNCRAPWRRQFRKKGGAEPGKGRIGWPLSAARFWNRRPCQAGHERAREGP